jgi:hypothetical protein
VNNRLAALRFFYIKTLKKAWSIAETSYPKRPLAKEISCFNLRGIGAEKRIG